MRDIYGHIPASGAGWIAWIGVDIAKQQDAKGWCGCCGCCVARYTSGAAPLAVPCAPCRAHACTHHACLGAHRCSLRAAANAAVAGFDCLRAQFQRMLSAAVRARDPLFCAIGATVRPARVPTTYYAHVLSQAFSLFKRFQVDRFPPPDITSRTSWYAWVARVPFPPNYESHAWAPFLTC